MPEDTEVLHRVTHASSSTWRLPQSELLNILNVARLKNTASGLMGMLLYRNGLYMQFVERRRQDVDALIERLRIDPCHKGIRILREGVLPARLFPDWSMAYRNLVGIRNSSVSGYSECLQAQSLGEGGIKSTQTAAKPLLSWERGILLVLAVVFVAIALASAATRAPWCDEAYFAEPAFQILKIGRMATLVSPPSPIDDPRTFGTDKYIFWTFPLDIVLQAAWYKIVGFGMVRMRILSLLWGLVALGAWWVILKKLGADALLRVIALSLIALDYAFLRGSSEGRMDMMTAALGFTGIALFLSWEQRHYERAVFSAAFCCAASILTHPIGGMLATAALGVAMLWYSRGRFRLWHPLLAAVPYLLFFGAWGIYIAQAPDIFHRQLWNISGERLSAWRAPFAALSDEFVQRWAGPFGLGGGLGLRQLRALVLLAYAAGILWALFNFRRMKQSGFAILCLIPLLDILLLCFGDRTKNAAYLVHVLPWLGACLALLLSHYWRQGGPVVLGLVLVLQVAGSAYVISRLEYQRDFLTAVHFLQQHGGKVTGEAQLGFGLGFDNGLVTDDHRLGYYLDQKDAVFAMDQAYDMFLERYRVPFPAIYDYEKAKIARSSLIFHNNMFRIYQDPAVSPERH